MTLDPVKTVCEALRARGMRLVTAESLTAGRIAASIADVAGASAVLDGGFVTYCNAQKTLSLGVEAGLLAAHGPVHPDVAAQMAQGALARAVSATIAVAVTGVAGPGPADGHPAGTVYIATAHRGAGGHVTTRVAVYHFAGDREAVRQATVTAALELVHRTIENRDLDGVTTVVTPAEAAGRAAKPVKVGIGVIVRRGTKRLIGRRRGSHQAGKYCFPGGGLEPGEGLLDGAARELREEAGLTADALRVIGMAINYMEDIDQYYLTVYIEADVPIGEPVLREPQKCEGWLWVDAQSLPQPHMTPIDNLRAMGMDTRATGAATTLTRASVEFLRLSNVPASERVRER